MPKLANTSSYLPRIIDSKIERYLKLFGALTIEGPKWCGKSWTSSIHAKSEILLAEKENKDLAEISPKLILGGDSPRLIDEWQEVPSVFDEVRYEVDRRGKKGQFILTGSSTPSREGICHSGAGRFGKIKMRTMSLFETGDSSGKISLEDLCNGRFEDEYTGDVDLNDLAYFVLRGGWPDSVGVEMKEASTIPSSYIEAILDNEVMGLDNIARNKSKMRLLLSSLARNECTIASNRSLARDISGEEGTLISDETLAVYLDIFQRLYLIDNQKPFSCNIRSSKRLISAEKRHFCDVSLAACLLKETPEKLFADLNTFGFLFESLVEHDLAIYAESFDASIYHYRDYYGKEIDAVIEKKDGAWCAFEIKLGANKIDEAASNLLSIKKSLERAGSSVPEVMCVITGTANAAYKRKDGVYVVPFTSLRP